MIKSRLHDGNRRLSIFYEIFVDSKEKCHNYSGQVKMLGLNFNVLDCNLPIQNQRKMKGPKEQNGYILTKIPTKVWHRNKY